MFPPMASLALERDLKGAFHSLREASTQRPPFRSSLRNIKPLCLISTHASEWNKLVFAQVFKEEVACIEAK